MALYPKGLLVDHPPLRSFDEARRDAHHARTQIFVLMPRPVSPADARAAATAKRGDDER